MRHLFPLALLAVISAGGGVRPAQAEEPAAADDTCGERDAPEAAAAAANDGDGTGGEGGGGSPSGSGPCTPFCRPCVEGHGPQCRDFEEDCPARAGRGQCASNPQFMVYRCRLSCCSGCDGLGTDHVWRGPSRPREESGPCGLWLAESTIEGSGLGVFTGVALSKGDLLDPPDNAIYVKDFQRMFNKDGAWYEDKGGVGLWHGTREYIVDYAQDPSPRTGATRGTYRTLSGVGGVGGCHFALNNVHELFYDLRPPYDSVGLDRTKDPGAGGFTGYNEMIHVALRDVPAGAELFGDYGETFFRVDKRIETIGHLPHKEDYDYVQDFLNLYKEFLHKHKDIVDDTAKHRLWAFIKTDDNDALWTAFHRVQDRAEGLSQPAGVGSSDADAAAAVAAFKTAAFKRDLELLLAEIPRLPATRNALPNGAGDADDAMEVGLTEHELKKSTRSPEWFERNGQCLDNIKAARSTLPQAGLGAFATRFIPEGGLVGPGPAVHISDRKVFDIYDGKGERVVGRQVWLNYCFGHRNTTVLICPYGGSILYVNHRSENPNAKIVWADDSHNFDHECMKKTPSELLLHSRSCTALDFVATRDIMPGEEVFINYGSEWEEAWNAHVEDWTPPKAKGCDVDGPIRTNEEQKKEPYPESAEILCYEDLQHRFPCEILTRESDDDGREWYTAFVRGTGMVKRFAREDVELVGCEEEYIPNAFRHEIMFPDDMLPPAWNNRHQPVDDDSDGDGAEEAVGANPPPNQEQQIESDFASPPLHPGQVSRVTWRDDGTLVNKYSVRVGLPPKLTSMLRAYVDRVGLTNMFWDVLFPNPIRPGGNRFFDFDGHRWFVNRPEGYWNSNMHWASPADEAGHEEVLRVLGDAGFDDALSAVGEFFELDSLAVHGVGFIAVSHCSEGFLHQDMSETGGKFFNIIWPLRLEEGSPPEFMLRDDDTDRVGLARYELDVAYVVGDDAYHATAACDYRNTRGMRMAATVYIADINPDNVDIIASDTTQIFPVPDSTEWAMAQRARHWGGDNRLFGDRGRRPFRAEDEWDSCPTLAAEGKCESDPWETRRMCVKSCGIYLEDEEYYRLVRRIEQGGTSS